MVSPSFQQGGGISANFDASMMVAFQQHMMANNGSIPTPSSTIASGGTAKKQTRDIDARENPYAKSYDRRSYTENYESTSDDEDDVEDDDDDDSIEIVERNTASDRAFRAAKRAAAETATGEPMKSHIQRRQKRSKRRRIVIMKTLNMTLQRSLLLGGRNEQNLAPSVVQSSQWAPQSFATNDH